MEHTVWTNQSRYKRIIQTIYFGMNYADVKHDDVGFMKHMNDLTRPKEQCIPDCIFEHGNTDTCTGVELDGACPPKP